MMQGPVTQWRLCAILALLAIWTFLLLPASRDSRISGLSSSATEAKLNDNSNRKSNNNNKSKTPEPKSPAIYNAAPVTATTETPLPPPVAAVQEANRLLVTFAYFESETARGNLRYFIQHGLHDAADFIFVFNGETNATGLLPKRNNIKIVQRDNTCFDLGATGEVLRTNKLWKKYDRYIMMNASLRGPFLPHWSNSCWSDLFLNKITDEVKLIGITANCNPRFHIQSMIWATDRIGIDLLLDPSQAHAAPTDDFYGSSEDPVGLSACYNEYHKAIHAEIGSTAIITAAGYKVDAMMTSWYGIAKTDPQTYCGSIPESVQDTLREGDYFGFTIHPFETIFIKTNRNINPVGIEHLSKWMGSAGYTSYERCKSTRGGGGGGAGY